MPDDFFLFLLVVRKETNFAQFVEIRSKEPHEFNSKRNLILKGQQREKESASYSNTVENRQGKTANH